MCLSSTSSHQLTPSPPSPHNQIIPLPLIRSQHRERRWFGTRASEVEENTVGLSLSLSNHNNWRRLWPEKKSICYQMVPRWRSQLVSGTSCTYVHPSSEHACRRREENQVDRAVKEPLFSPAHFSFYLFPFNFRASCSHLHAVAVLTQQTAALETQW